jgi:hypothetical protein
MALFASRLSNRGPGLWEYLKSAARGGNVDHDRRLADPVQSQRKYEQTHKRAWRLCLFVLAVPV